MPASRRRRTNSPPDPWWDAALRKVHALTVEREFFIVDEVHDIVEAALGPPHHHNVWGALMAEAQARGYFTWTGRSVASERTPASGRTVKLFQSAYHRLEGYEDPDPVATYLRSRGRRGTAVQGKLL